MHVGNVYAVSAQCTSRQAHMRRNAAIPRNPMTYSEHKDPHELEDLEYILVRRSARFHDKVHPDNEDDSSEKLDHTNSEVRRRGSSTLSYRG